MLTTDQTSELAEMFRLLGEPNRLGIVANCLDGPLSVGEHLTEPHEHDDDIKAEPGETP